jgi:hypothetical protein
MPVGIALPAIKSGESNMNTWILCLSSTVPDPVYFTFTLRVRGAALSCAFPDWNAEDRINKLATR